MHDKASYIVKQRKLRDQTSLRAFPTNNLSPDEAIVMVQPGRFTAVLIGNT